MVLEFLQKFKKSSTIEVELSPIEAFDTNLIYYGRATKDSGEPEKREGLPKILKKIKNFFVLIQYQKVMILFMEY